MVESLEKLCDLVVVRNEWNSICKMTWKPRACRDRWGRVCTCFLLVGHEMKEGKRT